MRNKLLPLMLLFASVLLVQSCTKDSCTREMRYLATVPVYKTPDEIRQAIQTEAPRELENPGKIYTFGNILFINEIKKGIHIMDNSNPEAPVGISFINIPGNVDMAVMDNILYVDNYIDLLTFDISDTRNPQFLQRVENVFPPYFDGGDVGLLVDYVEEEIVQIVDCNSWNSWGRFNAEFDALSSSSAGSFFSNQNSNSQNSGGQAGVGGSMARFTIAKGHLYTVDNSSLNVFSLTDPTKPSKLSDTQLDWNIETIFPYGDNLFIGSSAGMYIFDNSTPNTPVYQSQFEHAQACDPVYVNDDYAYVTLRSGNACQGFTNQLDLIDITNLQNPKLEKTFPMDNPHGLSISNNTLFVCEGEFGVKTFNIEKPKELDQHQLQTLNEFHAYDIITLADKNLAIVIGQDGLYQFDYSSPSQLRQLSKININR